MVRDPLFELADRHLIRYVPGGFAPFVVERAQGSWVWDTEGHRVLDFTSGQICSTIGHNHQRIVEAIRDACDRVLHLNSWMLSEVTRDGGTGGMPRKHSQRAAGCVVRMRNVPAGGGHVNDRALR